MLAKFLIRLLPTLLIVQLVNAQNVPKLVDDQKIEISGSITLKQSRNRSFILLKLAAPWKAMFDEPANPTVLSEVGLVLPGIDIEPFANQSVTVFGKVQLEPTSPYYYNGALIVASSIQLSNGNVLQASLNDRQVKPTIENIRKFHVLATFDPGVHSFTYRAWTDSGRPLASGGYLSCSLNGSGDVMNCFCPSGYAATGQGGVSGTRFVELEKPTNNFGQFLIGDELKAPISRAVQCEKFSSLIRTGPGNKNESMNAGSYLKKETVFTALFLGQNKHCLTSLNDVLSAILKDGPRRLA